MTLVYKKLRYKCTLFSVICGGVEDIYINIRVLPGTSLEYVGLLQRNQVPAQSHGVGVEVRIDGYSCIVPTIGQRKEYLGGNADTLDAEVAIYVAPFVGIHLDVRYGSVYCYTANTVRSRVYGIEGRIPGT